MKKSTNKKSGVRRIKAWGFLNDESEMYPLDICPVFDTKDEAKREKKSSPIYYSNTKIIPVLITPLSPVSSNKPMSNKRIGKKGR